jgi:pimeloyl-ACP methyl ester carboxylesterase
VRQVFRGTGAGLSGLVVALALALALPLALGTARAQADHEPELQRLVVEPLDPPRGLVVLFPGFARTCVNLRGLARALADAQWSVVCEPGIDARWLDRLHRGVDAVSTQHPTPPRWLLAGHSAGGSQALLEAMHLSTIAPGRLAGLLLLDPVARDPEGFGKRLVGMARQGVPLHVELATASRCNAHGSTTDAVQAAAAQAPALRPVGPAVGSTHLDAEGEDADALAMAACGEGPPSPAAVRALRQRVQRFAQALALK